IAAVSRAVSAPESQPSLLTETRASSTPVIAATADFSACATAACDTITPRSGSLIVLLEVLLQLAPFRHTLEEALVEVLRRIHAADLHVVSCQLMPPADQHVVPVAGDVDDVVRHQPVTALDQIEHALALADPRAAEEQQADAEHVGERRVHRRIGRERLVEERLQAAIEFGG